jgi:hypothetical protein
MVPRIQKLNQVLDIIDRSPQVNTHFTLSG